MNAAIAQHLNVIEGAILEVRVWAQVLWVRVRGLGCRFVSKKVVKMETKKSLFSPKWNKPQVKDAIASKQKFIKKATVFLIDQGLVEYHANVLAREIAPTVVSEFIDSVSDDAPNVFLGDAIINVLLSAFSTKVLRMDENNELEAILDRVAREEENKEYGI